MLHTVIRSTHHLITLIKEEACPVKLYYFYGSNNLVSANVIKITRKNGKTDVFVDQTFKRTRDFDPSLYEKNKVEKIQQSINIQSLMHYKQFQHLVNGNGYIMFVDDMSDRLEKFIGSNKKIVAPVISKLGCSNENMTKLLFSLSNDSPNLFVWAIKNYYKEGWRINVLQHALYFATHYSTIANKLSKGTITAYRDWDELRKEIHRLSILKKANDVINTFNTAQKKMLKKMELTDEMAFLLNKFQRLSQTKQVNFIQKMSTVEDVSEIIKQMEILTNKHFDWSYASLKAFVKTNESVKSRTIYDNGQDFIIFKAETYESIKYLAKATNWCIAKNKKYWNQYVKTKNNATSQFIMFDFTKKEDDDMSIIGITIDNKGFITAAHSFTNQNLLGNREYIDGHAELLHVTPFLVKVSDIYSLLASKGISIETFMGKISNRRFKEWSQKDFMGWVNSFFSLEDIDIHYKHNGILLLSIPTTSSNTEKLKRMFGSDVFNRFMSICQIKENGRMLYICDFKQSIQSNNKSYITFTSEDKRDHVETNHGYVFNSIYEVLSDVQLTTLLGAFNIPLDNIKIPTDNITLWESCLSCCDFSTMSKLLIDKQFINIIRNSKYNCDKLMRQMLHKTLLTSHSLDLLNFIYDNGYKLSDFMGNPEDIFVILLKLYEKVVQSRKSQSRPSVEVYESILNKTWNGNAQDIEMIIYYHTFKRIIESEKNNSQLFKYLLSKFDYFNQTPHTTPLIEFLIHFILDNYDISTCLDKYSIDCFMSSIRPYIKDCKDIRLKLIWSLPDQEFIEKYVVVPCGSPNF